MEDTKRINVVRAGGTASTEVAILPGDNVEQLCTLAAPELGLPPDGSLQLHGPDGNPIKGDLYKVVKDGDTFTLVHTGVGG